MPASTSAILKNVARMAHDAELTSLWTAQATGDRTNGQAWLAFIEAADAAHIADRIPGSVGRRFAQQYANEPTTGEAVAQGNRSQVPRQQGDDHEGHQASRPQGDHSEGG